MYDYQIGLLSKFSTICCVMPYYDYADKAIQILQTFSKKSRTAQMNFKQQIVNSLVKRTLQFSSEFGEQTCMLLSHNDNFMMYKLGVKLKDPQSLKLFSLFLNSYPKVIFDNVCIKLTKENYLLVNDVVKSLMKLHMVAKLGMPLEKFLKIKCSNALDLKNSSLLYISKQDFSHYGLIDQQNRLGIVDTVYLSLYFRRRLYNYDCK